jgi:hypothetical protein
MDLITTGQISAQSLHHSDGAATGLQVFVGWIVLDAAALGVILITFRWVERGVNRTRVLTVPASILGERDGLMFPALVDDGEDLTVESAFVALSGSVEYGVWVSLSAF